MFTGIVSGVGRIVEARPLGNGAGFGRAVSVAVPPGYLGDVDVGDSIALSGACMTVLEIDAAHERFSVEVSAESLARTAGLGEPGEVNLEKSLRAESRLDGHLVSGHVDAVGRVSGFARVGESWRLEIAAPAELAPFLARKGSVAVDGVSLTVNGVVDNADGGCRFDVNLIAHTAAHTTLGRLAVGRPVNLEVDPIARYVERMLAVMQRR